MLSETRICNKEENKILRIYGKKANGLEFCPLSFVSLSKSELKRKKIVLQIILFSFKILYVVRVIGGEIWGIV